MLFQNMYQIYTRLINIISFLYLLLTNHETLYNLDIVLSFLPTFERITALFTITGMWPYIHYQHLLNL